MAPFGTGAAGAAMVLAATIAGIGVREVDAESGATPDDVRLGEVSVGSL